MSTLAEKKVSTLCAADLAASLALLAGTARATEQVSCVSLLPFLVSSERSKRRVGCNSAPPQQFLATYVVGLKVRAWFLLSAQRKIVTAAFLHRSRATGQL